MLGALLAMNLTLSQLAVLDIARRIGGEIGFPTTIQAIALVESSAGAFTLSPHESSVGIMQVKPSTAEYVHNIYPDVIPDSTDYALALEVPTYNILVGTYYFKRCMELFGDYNRAVVCYNVGIKGASEMDSKKILAHPYLSKVKEAVDFIMDREGRSPAFNDG